MRGVSRADLATRVRVPLPMLVAWEEGIARPDPSTLERVAAALGLGAEQLVPQRQAMRFVPGNSDQVRAFVRIVESMRNVAPGGAVRFRMADLQALADVLGTDSPDVEARIATLLSCTPTEARTVRAQLLARRLLVPVAVGAIAAALFGGQGAAKQAPAKQAPAKQVKGGAAGS
jgi:transcriptional regulator with XRE-family HTH domain